MIVVKQKKVPVRTARKLQYTEQTCGPTVMTLSGKRDYTLTIVCWTGLALTGLRTRGRWIMELVGVDGPRQRETATQWLCDVCDWPRRYEETRYPLVLDLRIIVDRIYLMIDHGGT